MSIEDSVKEFGPLATARKTALMTQDDLCELLGKSIPTIIALEKNPLSMTLEQLGAIYHAVGTDGKVILEKMVNDIFLG